MLLGNVDHHVRRAAVRLDINQLTRLSQGDSPSRMLSAAVGSDEQSVLSVGSNRPDRAPDDVGAEHNLQ